MGYRTHLILDQYKGKKEEVIFDTRLNQPLILEYHEIRRLLSYYCIGKIYFTSLPEIFEKENKIETLYFVSEASDDGEISVKDFLTLIKFCQEKHEEETNEEEAEDMGNEWLWQDWASLIKKIEEFLTINLIFEDEFIKFECF